MANVPEIRFKGFVDDWEQCKLGEIAEIKDSARIPNNEWQSHGVPYLRSSDISSKKINGELFISLEKYDFYKNRTGAPKKGDLLFNSGGDIGLAIYKNDETDVYVQGGSVLYVKTSESKNINGLFLQYHFSTSSTKTYITNNSTGSTIKHFVLKPAGQIPIDFPCINEQTCIGTFFRTLDNIIAIYKRKLDGLRELKKAYLQQMFPQAGEVVPRVRFKGFTAPWHIKKVSELVTLTVREIPKPTESYKRISVRSHAKGTFHQIVEDPSKIAMDNVYVVHENDLIVNITFAWEHAIAVASKQDHGLLVSHRFPTYEINKSDINFLRFLITQEGFRRKLELISPGGAGRNRVLNKNDFADLELIVPCANEQTIIGMFFNMLDKNITAQSNKVELLKQLKLAYLQKMFV